MTDHPRRVRRLHAPVVRLCAAVLVAAAVVAAPPGPALAAGGGGDGHSKPAAEAGNRPDKETTRPRTQADLVGGHYMQLNLLWLPIFQGQRSRYQAVTARLVPHPDKRILACFKAPWAQEAILFELNETPLRLDQLDALDADALKQRVLARVHAHVGEADLYTDVLFVPGIEEPAATEQDLSFMCR
ncbi:hypothetical protein [Roseospira goensis]|uniref:Uncharacterized protein n=1 Tax=Roseospira goensis TaxID=391922 RepID=A0A7W6RYE5_9PROT|nr:hypothetical protein [Roseospira goensis]MBB4284995.1 hypothetical protein [Roseospira goensis]